MTVPATKMLIDCLQRAALGKQGSGSARMEGMESEMLQLLRGIVAQYATHGSLRCARFVWHGALSLPVDEMPVQLLASQGKHQS